MLGTPSASHSAEREADMAFFGDAVRGAVQRQRMAAGVEDDPLWVYLRMDEAATVARRVQPALFPPDEAALAYLRHLFAHHYSAAHEFEFEGNTHTDTATATATLSASAPNVQRVLYELPWEASLYALQPTDSDADEQQAMAMAAAAPTVSSPHLSPPTVNLPAIVLNCTSLDANDLRPEVRPRHFNICVMGRPGQQLTPRSRLEAASGGIFVDAPLVTPTKVAHVHHQPKPPTTSAPVAPSLYMDLLSLWHTYGLVTAEGVAPQRMRPSTLQKDRVDAHLARVATRFNDAEVLSDIATRLLYSRCVPMQMVRRFSPACLFWGPAGTGKTTVALEALLRMDGVRPLWFGTSPELNSPFFGGTEKQLLRLYNLSRATPNVLCVIVIDEIDTLVGKRTYSSTEHKIDHLSLLLRLLGDAAYSNVLLVGSTNRLHVIEPAFLRSGRCDVKFFLGRLTQAKRVQLAESVMQQLRVRWPAEDAHRQDLQAHVRDLTLNMTGADVTRLMEQCALRLRLANSPGALQLTDTLLPELELTLGVFVSECAAVRKQAAESDPDLLEMESMQRVQPLHQLHALLPVLDLQRTRTLRCYGLVYHSMQQSLTAYSPDGHETHTFECTSSASAGGAASVSTLADPLMSRLLGWLKYEFYAGLTLSKFSNLEDSGCDDAIRGLKHICQLYAPRGGVLVRIDLDEIVGFSEQISHSSSRGADAAAAHPSISTTRTPDVLRRAAFLRLLEFVRWFGESFEPAQAMLLVATQQTPLLDLFLKSASWSVRVSREELTFDLERAPGNISMPDGRRATVATTGPALLLTEQGFRTGRRYWTITLNQMTAAKDIHIGFVLGLGVTRACQTNVMLGGQAANAADRWYALSLATGTLHCWTSGKAVSLLPPTSIWEPTNTIGVLVDLTQHGCVWLFKNDQLIGLAFTGITQWLSDEHTLLYPSVSLRTAGDSVSVRSERELPIIPEHPRGHAPNLFSISRWGIRSSDALTITQHDATPAHAWRTVRCTLPIVEGSCVYYEFTSRLQNFAAVFGALDISHEEQRARSGRLDDKIGGQLAQGWGAAMDAANGSLKRALPTGWSSVPGEAASFAASDSIGILIVKQDGVQSMFVYRRRNSRPPQLVTHITQDLAGRAIVPAVSMHHVGDRITMRAQQALPTGCAEMLAAYTSTPVRLCVDRGALSSISCHAVSLLDGRYVSSWSGTWGGASRSAWCTVVGDRAIHVQPSTRLYWEVRIEREVGGNEAASNGQMMFGIVPEAKLQSFATSGHIGMSAQSGTCFYTNDGSRREDAGAFPVLARDGTPTLQLRLSGGPKDIWGVVFGLALSGEDGGTLSVYRRESHLHSSAHQVDPAHTVFVATLARNLNHTTVRAAASMHWGISAFSFYGNPLFSPFTRVQQPPQSQLIARL